MELEEWFESDQSASELYTRLNDEVNFLKSDIKEMITKIDALPNGKEGETGYFRSELDALLGALKGF
jgi:hypothetical protein